MLFYFGILQLTLISLNHLCKTYDPLLILRYVVCIAALDIYKSDVFNKRYNIQGIRLPYKL